MSVTDTASTTQGHREGEQLVRWVVDARFDDLSAPALRAVRRSVLDVIGAMAAGRRHPAIRLLRSTLEEVAPTPPGARHLVIGHERRTGMAAAATLNAAMGHVLDFDDTILPSRAHLSSPLLAGLLAAAERRPVSGRRLVTAFAVGFEVATRCADAVHEPGHGWHPTGVMGTLGVAAAVSRAWGLSLEQAGEALALAANQASGLRSSYGSMTKAFNVGRAASSGLTAALLARGGMSGGGQVFEAEGFLGRFSDRVDTARLVEGLGTDWAVERNGFKPYPCGFVTHAAIDATLEARAALAVDGPDVTRLELRVCPETLELTGNQDPTTGLEAKFSVHHAVAAAYLDGEVTPASFTDRAVRDERYASLAGRVHLEPVAAYEQGEASLRLVTTAGEVRAHVPHALGTPENPMDDRRLGRKFTRLASPILGDGADRLARLVAELERHDSTALVAALAGRADGDVDGDQ